MRLFAPDAQADLEALQTWFFTAPRNADNAKQRGVSSDIHHTMLHLDGVEHALKQWISGTANNLADVREVCDAFFECLPESAARVISFCVESMYWYLVEHHQYYELAHRIEILRKHLRRRYGITCNGDFEKFTKLAEEMAAQNNSYMR
ncbi:MAG: hypothetical protein EAZ91_07460 [Cytophagales bacterium]|nr:MAG: hypothetical protein EAZ91_07460 [Cytophagales bacterium]